MEDLAEPLKKFGINIEKDADITTIRENLKSMRDKISAKVESIKAEDYYAELDDEPDINASRMRAGKIQRQALDKAVAVVENIDEVLEVSADGADMSVPGAHKLLYRCSTCNIDSFEHKDHSGCPLFRMENNDDGWCCQNCDSSDFTINYRCSPCGVTFW